MTHAFPTKHELRCSGVSFIVSHILLCIAWSLISLWNYDIYDVKNEQDVITLHNALSSATFKIRIEIAATCAWISFPLCLIALYGLKKNALIVVESTSAEMYVYLFEKAYIIWITVALIIIPAVCLVIVSHDWSFVDGYYIQLFLQLFQFELIDCIAVADAVFMISLFIIGTIITFRGYSNKQNPENQRFKEYLEIIEGKNNHPLIRKLIRISCIISLFIVFLVILFEFAESGFFSITGYAKFLLVAIFVCKMVIGATLIANTSDKKYSALKKIWENRKNTQT